MVKSFGRIGFIMIIPSGPSDAHLMIVAECVSYRDLQSNTILNDREFDRMLSDAGIDRTSCFVTALVRGAIRGQNFDLQVAQSKKAITPDHVPLHNRYVRRELIPYIEALQRDIDLVKPKIILALGNGPLFALTGRWGIKSWRGSILDYTSPNGHSCKIIATYTPSFIQSVWKERNFVIYDLRKAWGLARSDAPIVKPTENFLIEPSFPTVCKVLDQLMVKVLAGPTKLANDIETRGGHLACIGLAWSKTDAICIPFLRAVLEPSEKMHYWRAEEEAYITFKLYKLLTHPNCHNVGQNFIYDAQYYYRWFLYVPNFIRDTMWTQHCMFSSMPKGLDVLSSLHCQYHVYWKDESKNWDPKLGERQLWIYNCRDAIRTYEIDDSQQAAIDAWSEQWPELRAVHDFQQNLFYPVLQTMNTGLRVDNDSKGRLANELGEAITIRNNYLKEVLGFELNIKSPKQMQDCFYRLLAQKPVVNRKTGNPTTDDAALERIAAREPLLLPICKTIRELRSLGVFKSTFLEAPLDIDARMRCSFNVAGTETFRFSSSENAFGSGMNLQNIPTGDENEGLPNIKKLFLADPNMEFFDIDLDSADLRVVTWDSDCAGMKKYFAEGKKPYVEVAKNYFQDDSITKEHDAYKAFKVICHATNYLGKGSAILSRMPKSAKIEGINERNIDSIQEWYFKQFPEIKDWQNRVISDLRQHRYVQNVFGYRIYFFDRLEGNIFNEAIAAIPQSTVACLINRGYRAIYENEPDIQILLQVHDSLAGQYPIARRDYCRQKVIDHCSVPLPYSSGELIIPVGIKTSSVSWGDCE
jgi:DNA polymerase I-like protein with 3'-5' exonuclease and polymerase domains/uracil-DNA glycosylase